MLSLHLLTLFGLSSSFELSNDLLWKWFRGKECWNWLFRSLFPLNGFLPSGVWKSRVLFQWPPSQQVNWSSFLSSLLPLKVHRIIKSRFGSTYIPTSFLPKHSVLRPMDSSTLSTSTSRITQTAILQYSTTQSASSVIKSRFGSTYLFPSKKTSSCGLAHEQFNFEH